MATREEILADLSAGKIDAAEAGRQLDQLEKRPRTELYCKVSAKGALSLYGLQRMPVTLYAGQWERLLAYSDELRKFMAEHASEFSRKGP